MADRGGIMAILGSQSSKATSGFDCTNRLTSKARRGIVRAVASAAVTCHSCPATGKHHHLTSARARGILPFRHLLPSHRSAVDPTTRSLGTLPSAKRAGLAPETSPGARRSFSERGPLVFCSPCEPDVTPVPSQLNRDDAHATFSPLGPVVRGSQDLSKPHYEEFDPGSGRTLAACLMHARRTHGACSVSGARLSITWERALGWGITVRKRR